ncbi:NADP-specific glutamate dehydrogenase [Salibacterium qingdaonense]|uniref:Glutamate dehydrogenase n=1 Tax=Salibacterium qingdaonense TaxID=266892 RepID=A0A1I4PIX3_9BACI|nr:NADP-specific glutamate dehydrogenase [Salibacterium qingdaonense]SFM27540.1 glutamate dehydrogenase (NADP+) [Salibacterium qingdaonense]
MTTTHREKNEQTEAGAYIDRVYQQMVERNPGEDEFHQAVREIFDALEPVFEAYPMYRKENILERMVEPERMITFRVPWVDDEGSVHINRGFRVQFNSALGPYKGGTRFHPSVNAGTIKFLGFEQILKNALTEQPIGGGKGGADFDPKGKSDAEIMRFCQSFMNELHRYIGPDTDIPAGDIGVGPKEIGYMFGEYKKLRGRFESGAFTGKAIEHGGILGRTEATGYGAVYFMKEMLKDHGQSFENQTVVVSGAGNVSIHAMEKAAELGAHVVACSDSRGYIYDKNGINIETVREVKQRQGNSLSAYTSYHPDAEHHDNPSAIWQTACDIALPCATQNEINEEAAKTLTANNVKAVGEGANMPSTLQAIRTFQEAGVLFAPAKAVNAGGVAVSALEMAQNSSRLAWTFQEVDDKLQDIMKTIYQNSTQAAQSYGRSGDLASGANIAGFVKTADAMIKQGIV